MNKQVKFWMRNDGTIAERASDDTQIGDVRIVNEKFSICDHCGKFINGTTFGVENMMGRSILTLCDVCDLFELDTKTKKAEKIKKKYKGTPVKQSCCGWTEESRCGQKYMVFKR